MAINLSDKLVSDIQSTKFSNEDKIVDLLEKIQVLEDALSDADLKLTQLTADNKILNDNDKIKTIAVRYARFSLILVPLICLIILLLSANEGGIIFIKNWSFYLNIKLKLNTYAQAALIIAPIAFFATTLGFLLKGVFGQKVESSEKGLTDLAKALEALK